MKKAFTIFFFLLMTVGQANASFVFIEKKPAKENPHSLTDEQKARLEAIKKRVAEIQSIDKSTLNKADRTALRRELKHMKKEATKMSNKTFLLAIGVVIIVILILILAF